MDINLLVENPWNPNQMSKEIFEGLVNHIGNDGFLGAIIARPHPKKKGFFEIVDGAHRFKAAKKLGLKTIPVIVKDFTEEQARVATVRFNRETGQFNKRKLGENVVFLKEYYSEEKLLQFFRYSKDELADLLRLGSMPLDEITKSINKSKAEEDRLKPVILDFMVSAEEEKVINGALNKAHFENKSKALVKLSECYLNRKEKGRALVKIAKEMSQNKPLEGGRNESFSEKREG